MAGDIDRLSDALHDATRKALDAVGFLVEGEAKRQITDMDAIDTGALKASITHKPEGDDSVLVGTNIEYAAHVEYGTGPHDIRPKDAKALYWKGAAHPVKVVHHPGSAAKPFLRGALAATKHEIPRIFTETFEEALKTALR